jgi:hypothetical protein
MAEDDFEEDYSVIEYALAALYGADDATRASLLRSRTDNLKRVGVLGINQRRGQSLVYNRDRAVRLGLALELQEFGIQPAVIAILFRTRWGTARQRQHAKPQGAEPPRWISEIIDQARASDGQTDHDVILTVQPAFASARWRGESELPVIGLLPSGSKGREAFWSWLQEPRGAGLAGSRARFCVFNLSAWLRDFDAALHAAGARVVTKAPPKMRRQRERA